MYNYSKLININNKFDIDNEYMKRFYFTNNIAESINQKLDFYLQKRKTTALDFIEAIRNTFINYELKNKEAERYDFKTRTIITIIKCENLNNEFKWIKLDEYKKYLKIIINEKKHII